MLRFASPNAVIKSTLTAQLSLYSTRNRFPYEFTVGASFAGKPSSKKTLREQARRYPHDSDISRWTRQQLKARKTVQAVSPGEDAFFVHATKSKSRTALGVADGVGGWSDSGIDPGVFSQGLMFHCAGYFELREAKDVDDEGTTGNSGSDPSLDDIEPLLCLRQSYGAVLKDPLISGGSSTALILTLDARSGALKAANLGDSGFMVIRNNTAVHIQEPQTHYFNCPKQLAKIPAHMRQNSNSLSDLPDDADLASMSLKNGDIILCYTDGVSDNLWPQDLVAISNMVLRQEGPEEDLAQTLADAIVLFAQQLMHRTDRVSPFEDGAALEGQMWQGGKVDDATVVVALVSEEVHDPTLDVPII